MNEVISPDVAPTKIDSAEIVKNATKTLGISPLDRLGASGS
jgi:hypothetical protein